MDFSLHLPPLESTQVRRRRPGGKVAKIVDLARNSWVYMI